MATVDELAAAWKKASAAGKKQEADQLAQQIEQISNDPYILPYRPDRTKRRLNNIPSPFRLDSDRNPEPQKKLEKWYSDQAQRKTDARRELYFDKIYKTAKGLGANDVQAALLATRSAHETIWGNRVGHNVLFGTKATKYWKGNRVNLPTHEEKQGKLVKENDDFRAYDSMPEAVQDQMGYMAKYYPTAWEAPTARQAIRNDGASNYSTKSGLSETLMGHAGGRGNIDLDKALLPNYRYVDPDVPHSHETLSSPPWPVAKDELFTTNSLKRQHKLEKAMNGPWLERQRQKVKDAQANQPRLRVDEPQPTRGMAPLMPPGRGETPGAEKASTNRTLNFLAKNAEPYADAVKSGHLNPAEALALYLKERNR